LKKRTSVHNPGCGREHRLHAFAQDYAAINGIFGPEPDHTSADWAKSHWCFACDRTAPNAAGLVSECCRETADDCWDHPFAPWAMRVKTQSAKFGHRVDINVAFSEIANGHWRKCCRLPPDRFSTIQIFMIILVCVGTK
jgi:hypothetical protein